MKNSLVVNNNGRKLNTYYADDLFNMDLETLWALPPERHIVICSDGEVESHTRSTIISVYLWYPMRTYRAPIKKRYMLGYARFTSRRMLEILNDIVWGIHFYHQLELDTEHLAKVTFDTVNQFYNDFTVQLSASVATLSMFDVLDVMYHPTIKKANDEVEPTELSIENCYKQIRSVLNDVNELRGNPLAESVRSGTLKADQILQCIGPRGFNTDINSDIFPEPNIKGYVKGIDDLHGALIESRMGTKSLLYNKELLRATEYFNRKTQLIAEYVQRLHPGDCGTPHLVDFPVMENLLPLMKGKYYQDPETRQLIAFTGKETHLIGQKVRMRSVLSCIHPNPSGICSVCYGTLAWSIPRGTNLGQVSAVSMGDKITSSVLSTKHLDTTSKVEKFVIHQTEGKYIRYNKTPETLYLRRELKGRDIKITVFRHEARSLADVIMLNDLSDYPITNATQLTHMWITVDEGTEHAMSDTLKISLYNRKTSFSRELLEHIQKVRWRYDENENIVISLKGFDINKPFLSLPYKHVNMYEVMLRIQTFLHSGSDNSGKPLGSRESKKRIRKNFLKNYHDPVDGLVAFATILNEKLNINIAHCEILVYAMMIRSGTLRDYRLPKPGISGAFEKYTNLMTNRSLGGMLAYEKQDRVFINPRSFIHTNRNDHPYDIIIKGGVKD